VICASNSVPSRRRCRQRNDCLAPASAARIRWAARVAESSPPGWRSGENTPGFLPMNVSRVDVDGVVTFYHFFSKTPVGKNTVYLNNSSEQISIITGPNMAGKSTYLRQVGLVTLMAQIGSFVPAKSAQIGLVDKIFTRVGASDNLAGGESTFLMEMHETANILNNATPKSLILLDEIGRGTSTFDGLSIAWSVAEYLHNASHVAAKTLFATHYHELTELALILPRVKNYNVAVKEWGDKVIFLRKIVPGGCDHSYGIQVAQLAGLPRPVIARAKEVLSNLEADELTPNDTPRLARHEENARKAKSSQLDFFAEQENKLREALSKIDIESITPIEAMNKLYELKKLIEDGQRTSSKRDLL